jgi:hypothetical protein
LPRLPRVEGEEGGVDVQQRLLLSLREAGVGQDGQLDRPPDPGLGADDARADVELLGGDPQRLGDLLQDLGLRAAQAALDLAQVGVADADLLGELPQGESRREPLLPEEVTEGLDDGLPVLAALAHVSIVLTPVSKMQTPGR